MKLHILGCGDAFGSGGRNHSGYLIEAEDRLFLLDCGPTTLLTLKRAGFSPRHVDVIFISHLHGDHYAGLPFFLLDSLYENPRSAPLQIAGPPGIREQVESLFDLLFGDTPEGKELPPARFSILEPERRATIEGIEIFSFRVPHQVRAVSLGLKVSYGGKQILYSGDSAWTDLFVTHAQGVDLFLCECCFFDRDTANHMNYQKLRQNLPRLGCKNMILTHMGAEMLERRTELAVKTAEDGMVVEI